MKLWYEKPAKKWNEALPVGNGRLGGMVFGSIAQEKIQLNEDSIWYGGPAKQADNRDIQTHLQDIRRLLGEGAQEEAEYLARMAMMSSPKYLRPYQPLGELMLHFRGHRGSRACYRRELDIASAIANTSYEMNGVRYRRELFVSSVDQVMVMKLTCDLPGGLTFGTHLMRRPFDPGTRSVAPNTIIMEGDCGSEGIRFATAIRVTADGGKVRIIGDFVSVEQADSAIVYLTAQTTFRTEDPLALSMAQLDAASRAPYETLRTSHTEEYQEKFRRVSLNLKMNDEKDSNMIPTNERLDNYSKGGSDLGLETLYFQYGRYLLISCSRPGSLAANLQGIWNDSFTPPWECKYTININTEMNYWPAEVTNLAECHEPLFDLIERMLPHGRQTAQDMYGSTGFVAHHNTNLWGNTHIEGILVYCSIWPMGGAWLSLHLWEHYRYGKNLAFLRDRAYPIMKEAAVFLLDYMVMDEQGRLVTGPSISPENRFILPNGQTGALCMGPSMDLQIARTLFEACLEAIRHLNMDHGFGDKLTKKLSALPAPKIGKHGQIMEWLEDYEEAEPGHRHISHLFGLFPGELISPHTTPELALAAERTLERRLSQGGGHTGWSRAWIILFWARLHKAEQAYANLRALLSTSTYPNLLDAHPPFQIDGNFGAVAGIAEMLIQSHAGELAFLPALPKDWSSGDVRGLRARGGLTVDISWEDGRLTEATIWAHQASEVRIRCSETLTLVVETFEEKLPVRGGLQLLRCEGRESYRLRV